ncbi:transmembrane epididymal protein 1-like [Ochotona princeps]|uniref:transmembrane epididymal protein 1-like n=1 Tax=Ochotona princeps TaxID=9978 RepID=UPI0027147F2A|nr:transmembrane epididymal protein 1-like [Ochotona princeps]XP_058525685.1 transmembrane epididymal protein 1-like [Ochotona princeps]
MGGFEGHLYPGLSFFLYGLHHAQLFSRALICNSPAQHPPCGARGRGPWARLWQVCDVGLVKILSACILVAQELHSLPRPFALLTKRYHQRDFLFRKQWQHITLYAAFLLSGCVDVASQHVLACRCVALEQGAQALGMAVLLPLMLSHMQDTEGVELRSHLLLTQVMFLLTLVLTAELWVPSELRLRALKAFLCALSGSWLMQLAFMLYRPMSGYKWMDDDHNDLAFVTTAFCCHVTCVAILMLWIHGCCWVCRVSPGPMWPVPHVLP